MENEFAPRNRGRRIVILGGGFAGAYCAQKLEQQARGLDAEVVLIDRNNYFIFHPLLVEAGTGSLEPRHAVVPIRSFLKTSVFRMAECTGVDWNRQEVVYRIPGTDDIERLKFDHLVIALGSVTRMPNVPGLREYGFEMKNIVDAVSMRDRAIQMLESADAISHAERRKSFLHFVVVGANFTGVEVAGELHAYVHRAARRYANLEPRDCRVTLIELLPRILTAIDEDLAEFARKDLLKRGLEIRLNSTITEIHPDFVRMNDGTTLPTRTVIWCAGIAPNPLLKDLGLPLDSRGYIVCERDLRVKGFENVWGIGDCAVNVDANGQAYPATAQHAVRQGTHLARNLARVLRGEPTTPCDITSKGSLAALGCRTAVAKVFGVKLAGFAAWFLWRTVYLLKMPQWSRRARIAIDWTVSLLFAPDFVQLGVHRARGDNRPPDTGS